MKVTCTSCKASEVWELNALITEVRNNGGNTDWHTARYAVKCPHRCAAPIIKLVPIPFGRERAHKQAHRHALINLSLQILREAAARSATEAVGTIEARHPWTSCRLPYRCIVKRLIERGIEVEKTNQP
ncbi:hypothetical protein KZ810_03320 [Sphingomonas sp. RHCKR47]|uniref:hypothetical protein n=1 Tax=Sphingomonas citricola TaxID=2862498 RepID=UPI001CA4E610|nr:hypothetical protein [Sphingomonas citricola]MBW6522517.1 hypothetical protein [Sphingomonas citricola]